LHLEILLIKLLHMERTIDLEELIRQGDPGTSGSNGTVPRPFSGTASGRKNSARETISRSTSTASGFSLGPAAKPGKSETKETAVRSSLQEMGIEDWLAQWEDFTNTVASKRPPLAVYLQQSVPLSAHQDKLILRVPVGNPIVREYLTSHLKQVTRFIHDYFGGIRILELQDDTIEQGEQVISRSSVHLNDQDRWESVRNQSPTMKSMAERFRLRLI